MTNITDYQRGRRAGENKHRQGVNRVPPIDVKNRDEWLQGFDSVDGVDVVNHPQHYTSHPSGIECIQITEHFDFLTGNAIKYLWRAGLKTEDRTEDLKKADWYIQRAIEKEDVK